MAQCKICHARARNISAELGVCLHCIRETPAEALALTAEAHRKSRAAFGLLVAPPKDPNGAPCRVCMHECRIPEGGIGYCGLRRNEAGKVKEITSERGKLSWYHDPLPTNCVGDWVCAGCIGAGYPRYAYCQRPEFGYTNLAVFFQACSFNCLFCQNWQFREQSLKPPLLIASTLLVPGYIDEEEIRNIASFIASVDPGIQYALLAFYPHFYMSDMPRTPA